MNKCYCEHENQCSQSWETGICCYVADLNETEMLICVWCDGYHSIQKEDAP